MGTLLPGAYGRHHMVLNQHLWDSEQVAAAHVTEGSRAGQRGLWPLLPQVGPTQVTCACSPSETA